MVAAAHQLPWRVRVAARLAGLFGAAVRSIKLSFCGVVGPLLVSVGVGMYSLPAGVIVAGLIVWALDRRV